MRAAFPHLGRGSWLSRRDPRVLLLAALVFVTAVTQLRDSRQLAIVLALGLAYYATARIPWRTVRPQWIYLLAVISFFAFFNSLITGGRTGTFSGVATHVLVTLPPFGT